jgi:type I restriction enzyme S subunit
MSSRTDYKRLGDYIQPVDVRNRDLKVTKLVGLTIDKAFIPSVANVIGTDLSNYKVIHDQQFACSLMQVSRDGRIPIAMLTEKEAIMSPAYPMFEVIDKRALLPEYLMMWCSREEFDREASFYAVGGVRGSLTWEDFCDMPLPVPSIERQRELVEEYETITRRIRLNELLCAKLEETAQTIYRKMFVDDIDPENLPEEWRWGTLGEVAEITMGQSPEGESYNEDGYGEIFYQGRTDFGTRYPSARMYTTEPTRMANVGDVLLSVRAPVGDLNIAPHDCCIGRGLAAIRSRIGCNSFIFYLLQTKRDDFKISNDDGTVFGSINKDALFELSILISPNEIIKDYEKKISLYDSEIELKGKENQILTKIQSLLLAKMGQ